MQNPLAQALDHVLNCTRDVWDKLRGQRVFITGGTGFFGCWLLESFAWANDKLGLNASLLVLARSIDDFSQKAPHLVANPCIQFRAGDVRTYEIPFERIDIVIHAASPVDPKTLKGDPIGVADIIVDGTRQMLRKAISAKVKRFLYISSGAVYGTQPPDLPKMPENYIGGPDVTNSSFLYAESKRYAEMLCSSFHEIHGIQTVVARPFTFIGPYQNIEAGFAATQFIRNAIRGEPIVIQGDGTPLRSYCYGADLAIALWKIVLHGKPGDVYNIGSEEAVSIAELAQKIGKLTGVKVIVSCPPVPGKEPARYIPDLTRLRTDLNVHPEFDLEYALIRSINWAKEMA